MKTKYEPTTAEMDAQERLFQHWQDHGPATRKELILAGFSEEEVSERNTAAVAERVRLLEQEAA